MQMDASHDGNVQPSMEKGNKTRMRATHSRYLIP